MESSKGHYETIECTECGMKQKAFVEYVPNFWNIYVHNCVNCNYVIMESEWNKVEELTIK